MGTQLRHRRTFALALTIAATVALGTTPTFAQTTAAPNLVTNPGFEETRLPAAVMDLQRELGIDQPVLPVGWTVEGASELFDHTHGTYHSGDYSAAISGSWSGPRSDCSVQCVTVPGQEVKDAAYGSHYSVAPSWVTDAPIPVKVGTRYKFNFWVKGSIWMDGSGATSWIRWLDANKLPIGSTRGPSRIADCGGANYMTFVAGTGSFGDDCHSPDWYQLKATVRAPAGAAFAKVVLSYSDSAWIGQVIFDDVFFG